MTKDDFSRFYTSQKSQVENERFAARAQGGRLFYGSIKTIVERATTISSPQQRLLVLLLSLSGFSSFLLGFSGLSTESTKANIYSPCFRFCFLSLLVAPSSLSPSLSPSRLASRCLRHDDRRCPFLPLCFPPRLAASPEREAPPARCTRSSRGLAAPVQDPSAQSAETLGIAGAMLRVPSPVPFLSSCRRWDHLPAPRAGGQDLRLLRLGLLVLVRLRRFSDPASPLPRVPHCRPLFSFSRQGLRGGGRPGGPSNGGGADLHQPLHHISSPERRRWPPMLPPPFPLALALSSSGSLRSKNP
ncbi:uncharacterized protein [Miscanthus floridulus]|uniref:uncharacterized protein n=1 Tax=Miscanthus floridulus TaxID=154761 RepID=UPI0034585BFB